jgi:hypothetical protein
MANRSISTNDATESILNGEIIEEYPKDKYGPSCLILGKTIEERHLHVVCSLPPRVRIITVYEPDTDKWIKRTTRRQP